MSNALSKAFVTALGKGLGITLAAGATLFVASEIPSMKRYLHILGLAKSSGKSRSNLMENGHGATYAQAPRRSGGTDEERGRARRNGEMRGAPSEEVSAGRP